MPARPTFAAKVAGEVVGADRVDADAPPVMGGEDFSYMLEARPGAFIFIGNGDTRRPAQPGLRFQRRGHPDRLLLLGAAGRDGDAGVMPRPDKGGRLRRLLWL